MKTKYFVFMGIIFNLVFCFLPSFDMVNLYSWVRLGLSFQNSTPSYYSDTNPAAFFISIFVVPISLIYQSTDNIYLVSVVLKLIIFIFLCLFYLTLLDILKFYSYSDKNIKIVTSLLLFNPGILFINFVWAEIDIIPSFFVLLAYYFLRFLPIRYKIWNFVYSVIALFIASFFFLYPIILIPAFILYTKNKRDKTILLVLSILVGILFLVLDIFIFRGSFYNYFGSLSGTSSGLAPSGLPTGIFYYFVMGSTQRLIAELLLVLGVSIVVPIILSSLKYPEVTALFVIICLFVYISPVINMDNFLFIVPFALLAIISSPKILSSQVRRICVISLIFIPVVFAPFVYSHQSVFGFFYWFYPLFHINGYTISYSIINSFVLPMYNYLFTILLYISITILLINRKDGFNLDVIKVSTLKVKNNLKKVINKRVVIIIVLLLFLFSSLYNINDNSTNYSSSKDFPLLYFNPESVQNGSLMLPIGQNSYRMNANTLYIPPSTSSMFLQRNIKDQNFFISGKIKEVGNSPVVDPLISTNRWALKTEGLINNNVLETWNPDYIENTNADVVHISDFTNLSNIYYLNGQSSIAYNINFTLINQGTFIMLFKPTNISSVQSIPFYLYNKYIIIEIVLYKSDGFIAVFKNSTGWIQSSPIYYDFNSSWNMITLTRNNTNIFLDFNGAKYSVFLSSDQNDFKLIVGNPLNNSNYSYIGFTTALYYSHNDTIPLSTYLLLDSANTSYIITPYTNFLNFTFSLTNNIDGSILNIWNITYNFGSLNVVTIGKQVLGASLYLVINNLIIRNNSIGGFYMVATFLSFSLPYLFSILAIIWIRKTFFQ